MRTSGRRTVSVAIGHVLLVRAPRNVGVVVVVTVIVQVAGHQSGILLDAVECHSDEDVDSFALLDSVLTECHTPIIG